MKNDLILENAGWNASVPPNGFINRPEGRGTNDNPAGLATTEPLIEIETTPQYRQSVTPHIVRKVEPAIADVEADGPDEPDLRAAARAPPPRVC